MGRGFAFLIVFLVGGLFGAMWTVSMIPDVTLADVLGEWASIIDVSGAFAGIAGATKGIMIALVWMVFGLVVATVFGGLSRLFRGARD